MPSADMVTIPTPPTMRLNLRTLSLEEISGLRGTALAAVAAECRSEGVSEQHAKHTSHTTHSTHGTSW